MDRLGQGIFECVRRREGREVGQHDVTHGYSVYNKLEHQPLVFKLCADEDKKAAHDEPWTKLCTQSSPGKKEQRYAYQYGQQANHLSQSGSGTRCLDHAVGAAEAAAEDPAGVQRVGGDEIQCSQNHIEPDRRTHQMQGSDQRPGKYRDIRGGPSDEASYCQGKGKIGQRTNRSNRGLYLAFTGAFCAVRIGVREESSNGQQKNTAQLNTVIGRSDDARNFTDEDRK